MKIDHFGIVVTLFILAIFLGIALLSQTNINILPETTTQNTAFADYCERLDLKC